MPIALLEVSGQHRAGTGMQWHVPVFTPFATADSEHPGLQIYILELEVARFTHAKARDAEQSKQAVIYPRQQGADPTVPRREWRMQRGMEQLFDLLIGIQVGPRPHGLKGQQTQCRNLRTRIYCASVTRELAYVTEPAGPIRRLRVLGHLCPPQCQRLRNVRGAATFHKRSEVCQLSSGMVHLEAKTSAQGLLLGNRLSELVHGTPPPRPALSQRMQGLQVDLRIDASGIRVLVAQHGVRRTEVGRDADMPQSLCRHPAEAVSESCDRACRARSALLRSNRCH